MNRPQTTTNVVATDVSPTESRSVPDTVRIAHQSSRHWRSTAPEQRTELLHRLTEELTRARDELVFRMAQEIGKPIRFGRVEIDRSCEMVRTLANRLLSTPKESAAGSAIVRRRPHGVVGVITPWNNPVYLSLGKIAPALAYGNSVVWKPAPEAHHVSHLVLNCLHQAGFPPDLIQLIVGGREEAEDLMLAPEVAAITITGSSTTGEVASEICSRRRIPLQAELGGNNAAIVCGDADLPDAARKIAAGAFEMAGQRCTANRRVIVEESVSASFLRLLIQETKAIPWGVPSHKSTRIGPIVNASHQQRIAQMVERSLEDCELMLFPQGSAPSVTTNFRHAWYPPVILVCNNPECEVVQEETFGPVLIFQTANNLEQALHLCNAVPQGLAAAIFTHSQTHVARFLDEAEAGILKVNQSTADAEVDVPFGGWKRSGIGPPEHGSFDLDFFTRPQTVYPSASELRDCFAEDRE